MVPVLVTGAPNRAPDQAFLLLFALWLREERDNYRNRSARDDAVERAHVFELLHAPEDPLSPR